VLVGSEAMAMLPAAVSAALRLLHITRVLRLSTR
jgi:hypothetical protein